MIEANRRVLFLGFVSLLCVGLLFLGVRYWVFAFGNAVCERQVFAEAVSPDGSWIARFYENVCGGGLGTTYVGETVEVARPDEDAHPLPTVGVVFEMEHKFDDQPKSRTLNWLSSREIEVTIPNDAWAGTQRSAFADLIISYKYVGDDPVERACLREWRTLPTDEMVRRSSSLTENMDAFLARCHADSGPR